MPKLKKIIKELHKEFPLSKAEKWDKPGLQYGNLNQVVNNVFVALDLTTEVFEEAINMKADLIITHHPFLWEDTKEENYAKAPYKELLNSRLENTGIALFSMHTNYDQAKNGTARGITKRLDYEKYYKSKSVDYAYIIDEDTNAGGVVSRFTTKFGITTSISNEDDSNEIFNKFAILPGSGSIEDILKLNKEEDINLIVTSDVKWSDWITIKEQGITVIEISHGIETVFAEDVSELINNKFETINSKYIHTSEIGKL